MKTCVHEKPSAKSKPVKQQHNSGKVGNSVQRVHLPGGVPLRAALCQWVRHQMRVFGLGRLCVIFDPKVFNTNLTSDVPLEAVYEMLREVTSQRQTVHRASYYGF